MHYIKKQTGILTFTCTVPTDSLGINLVTGCVGSWSSCAYSSGSKKIAKNLKVVQIARTCNLLDPDWRVSSAPHCYLRRSCYLLFGT